MSLKQILKAIRADRLIRKLNFSLKVRLNSHTVLVPLESGTGYANLQLKNDWLLRLFADIVLPANTIVVDVGANVGQTLIKLRCSKHDIRYIGFEPNPGCAHYVRCLIARNDFKDTHVVSAGLSSKNELVPLYLKSAYDEGATIVSDFRPGDAEKNEKTYVPVFSFDSTGIIKGSDRVSLVKIDVEGAESDVLAGMAETLRKQQPVVLCEVLDVSSISSLDQHQTRANTVYSLMKNLGYESYRINHADRIISFERIDCITLVQWTPKSADMNDYLFIPASIGIASLFPELGRH
jgi:FkbM family methyltransferase